MKIYKKTNYVKNGGNFMLNFKNYWKVTIYSMYYYMINFIGKTTLLKVQIE